MSDDFRCKFAINESILSIGDIHTCGILRSNILKCEGFEDDRNRCPYWNR